MVKFIGKRLAYAVLTLFLITTATFFLVAGAPGDPIAAKVGQMPEQAQQIIREKYGLDQPVVKRYDRQEMIDTLRNGKGVPIYSMMPDTIQVGEKTYTELVGGKNHFVQELQDEIKDPKALLIEGLKELGKDPDPSKVTIRYASRGTSEVSKKIAEWMKQQWESVLGINIEIDMMEWNIMWDKIDAGDYDIATGGWGPYYNEPSALLQLFDPDNGYFNAEKTGWSGEDPKKYQELLNEAKFEVDDQKKAELYLQAEELVVKSGLIEPTYVEEAPTFVKKYVKNYFVSTVGQVDFSKVYIEK